MPPVDAKSTGPWGWFAGFQVAPLRSRPIMSHCPVLLRRPSTAGDFQNESKVTLEFGIA